MFMPYWFVRQQQKNTKSTNYFYDLKILDYARGYLTKNKITYNVYLVGSKSDEKSNFSDNIGLLIQNNSTGEVNKIALEVDERSEEHTSELQSRQYLVCRLLLEKKKKTDTQNLF